MGDERLIDIDDMTESELNDTSGEDASTGSPEGNEGSVESNDSGAAKQAEGNTDKKSEADKEPEPVKKKFEEMSSDEKVEHLQKRVVDLQSGYTKEHGTRQKLERELADARIAKLEAGGDEKFDELSEDDLDELSSFARKEYEAERSKHEEAMANSTASVIRELAKTQEEEIVSFIKDQYGVDIDLSKSMDDQPEEVKALDGQMKKVADYLQAKAVRLGGTGKYKYFLAEQFHDANLIVNRDEILAAERAKAAAEIASSVRRAQQGGSSFDRHPSQSGATRSARSVQDSNLSGMDIDDMSEAELDSLLA
jgi:hypothetical protein